MASLTVRQLSEQIQFAEGGGYEDSEFLVQSAEAALGKLRSELQVLVGADGADAILRHALQQTRRDHDLLRGVGLGEGEEDLLSGLREHVQGVDLARTRRALVALLANTLRVVHGLIGKKLTLSILRSVWPDVVTEDVDFGDRS